MTEKEKDLFPNAQSHMLFGQSDVKYFQFLGRLLGKAMYDGITLEPKFADFFLRKLINK
jgi:ubiquitin-protein ligase E3 C